MFSSPIFPIPFHARFRFMKGVIFSNCSTTESINKESHLTEDFSPTGNAEKNFWKVLTRDFRQKWKIQHVKINALMTCVFWLALKMQRKKFSNGRLSSAGGRSVTSIVSGRLLRSAVIFEKKFVEGILLGIDGVEIEFREGSPSSQPAEPTWRGR